MSDKRERAELLAALHAAGAASKEDEEELEALLKEDASLEAFVTDFRDSITALATSFDPLQTPPQTFRKIQKQIHREKPGVLDRLRGFFSGSS